MALVHVHCPQCQSIDVVQYGKQANGTQRYRCNNPDCQRTIFLLQYPDKGRLPAVKQQIVDMTLNGSGVRDIVRVLGVSSATVIKVLKKKEPSLTQVNANLLKRLDPEQVDVILSKVKEAEVEGRTFQLGEGEHSTENAVRFWNSPPRVPKEAASRCYACATAYAMMIRLCNGCSVW